MSRRRIILGSPTQTGLIDELRLRIGEVGDDFSTGVATQAATSFGTGGVQLRAAKGDHLHPYLIAPKTLIQPVSPTTSTAGVSDYFPRGDHVHYVNPGAIVFGAGASDVSFSTSTAGVSGAAARQDHVHYLNPGVLDPATARLTAMTYTNNGSGPLIVMISHSVGTGGLTSVFDVDGVQAAEVGPTALRPIQVAGVVAPASEYYFSSSASSVVIKNWAEYQL
jgi:hypothetical protein